MPDETKLPDWLPLPIRQIAERDQSVSVAGGILEAETIFRRLIFDERMSRVWRELERQRNKALTIQRARQTSPGTAAIFRDPSAVEDNEKLWRWILENLFYRILSIAEDMPRTLSNSDIERATKLKQDIAEKHQEWAEELDKIGFYWDASCLRQFTFGPPYDPDWNENVEHTTLEMDDYYLYRDSLMTDDSLKVERYRTDQYVLGFVIKLAEITSSSFGSALVGTIANITNVRFNRTDMSRIKVRDLIRRCRIQLPVIGEDPGL